MGKYLNEPMEKLAADLKAGLARLKKGYVDAAEKLLQIVDSAEDYPAEFVVYRLTGFRGMGGEPSPVSMPGKTLGVDLLHVMIDVCDSCGIRTTEYGEPVYDTTALSRRFRVSGKTLQRWRRRGPP